MGSTHITDHAGEALDRLAEQYRGQLNFASLLNAINAQTQDIEDALFEQIDGRTLASATDATLDSVGATVGCTRPAGADDDEYRGLIYAQIIVNTSEGTPETVYALLRQLGATAARIFEVGLYGIFLQYTGTLLLDDAGLLAALEAATPPVAMNVSEYTADAFGFDGDGDALGFDDGELARDVV